MKTRSSKLLNNTLVNVAASLFSQAAAFATLPLLIKTVGLGDYGMYALAASSLGYFSIFSLMARTSVVKYIAEYRKGQEERIRSLFNNAVAANACIGLIIGVFLILIGYFCDSIFQIEVADVPRARLLLYLHAGATILLQPLTVFGSVLYGFQRYNIISLIDGFWAIVRTAVIVAIYFFDGTVFWLAWEEILCQFLKFTILGFYIRSRFPFIKVDLLSINHTDLKKIAFYGAWSLLYTASLLIVYQGSMLLIGVLLSVAMVTYFQIAYKLYNVLNTVSLFMNGAVLPASSSAIAGGERGFIEKLIIRGTRMNLIILLLLTGNIIIFSEDIIRFWMGIQFVGPAAGPSQILCVSWIFLAHSALMTQVYLGQRNIAPLSLAAFLGAVIQVLLAILLARAFGLGGIAFANAAYFSFLSIVSIGISARALKVRISMVLRKITLPIFSLVAAYFLCVRVLLAVIGRPQDLGELLILFFLSAIIGLGFSFVLVAREEVRAVFRMGKRELSVFS